MSKISIPKTWEIKKLYEIAEIGQGGTPSRSKNEYWNGTIPWLRSGELRNNRINDSNEKITELGLKNSSTKLCPKGTILMAMTGQGLTRGRTALLEIEACANQSCAHIINKNKDNLLTEFLWAFLQSKYWFIRSIHHGSGQPGINVALIRQLEVPIPPIETQKKIVQKLDYILEQLREKKNDIFSLIKNNGNRIDFFEKNWMAFIISKEIETHPHLKKWEIYELKYLTTDIGDGMHSTPNYIQNSEFYFINGNNLKNGSIVISEKTKMVDIDEYQRHKLDLTNKTVFLSINGTIGNLALYRNEKVILGKSACYINCNDKLEPEFLFYLLQSTSIKDYFKKEQTHTSIYNLSLKSIRKTPIMLPSLHEQKRIIQRIKNAEEKFRKQKTQFQNIKKNYENTINYVSHIQTSILNTAFSGKLVN